MPNALMPDVSSFSDPQGNALLAKGWDPNEGLQAVQSIQQIQMNQQVQRLRDAQLSSAQLTLGQQRLGALNQAFGALAANPTMDNFSGQLGWAVKEGVISPDDAMKATNEVMSFGGDPSKLKGWATDHMNQIASHDQLMSQAYGTPGMLNIGGSNVSTLTRTGPGAGTTLSGAPPIANTMSPGDKMGGVTTKNSDGSSTFRPNSTLYDENGNFIGGGGQSSAPSIPVYRGGAAPAAGGGQAGGTPAPRGSAPGLTPASPADQGGTGAAAGAGAGGGAPSDAAPAAGASAGQGGAGASAPSGMVTPNPQTLPVISADMAKAAIKAMQGGQNTPANRNLLRGYAVQNNLTDQFQHMGPFEAQPAGAGAGVVVPLQPTAGQGGAPAGGAQGTPAASMWTPTLATMPAITQAQAEAAQARMQAKQGTAADRNTVRAYVMQNNATQTQPTTAKGLTFEPQPGQPPQAAGQGGAVPPGRQPPAPVQPSVIQPQGQPTGAGQGSFGSRFGGQPAQGAGLTVGLSPGQEASLKAGSDGYAALSSDVSNPSGVNQRLFQLRTALGALRNTQTGLGTAQRQQLVGYLASLPGGLAKWAPGVDPDSASSYDIATKYLTAYSLNTPGAARSDAGLSTAQSANANTSGMMQKAAQDVTLSNIGLENGKVALLKAFNTSGADPGTFGKFASQWMQGTDPRAFALPDMTPAERGQLYTSLQGPAKAAFLATVKKGIAAKILTPNDVQGAAGNGQ